MKITAEDIRGQSVMLVRTSWHDYVDRLRQDLTRNGANIVEFDFYSLNVFNEAVKQNLPIMVIDGWDALGAPYALAALQTVSPEQKQLWQSRIDE